MKTKTCSRCGEDKPESDFYADRSKAGGRRVCKDCDHKQRRGQDTGLTDDRLSKLIKLTRGREVSLSDLCDGLDCGPSKARALIAQAHAKGVKIAVSGDIVGQLPHVAATGEVQDTKIKPTITEAQSVGVISDVHFGSKYCMREALKDFINNAYERGVREILDPGDDLDGIYSFSRWEQSHHGIEEQSQDMLETLPKLKGLTYHRIGGNHDETFHHTNGIDVGEYLVNRFRRAGRNDLFHYGDRGATIRIRGAVVELWHPMGGGSYARSYKLQKHIEGFPVGQKPQILLTGHWHQYCHVFERGVHAFLCPTFQSGGSKFGKALGGAPACGGMILSWRLTADGTMRDFDHSLRSYYVDERPVDAGAASETPAGVRSRG